MYTIDTASRNSIQIITQSRLVREPFISAIRSRYVIQYLMPVIISKVDLNIRETPVKCYIWSTASYDAENCTLRAVDQKHLESS